ncbi:unnamed protein product [Blepharisma stoltei]|uniref:C2H2-type domain-containing protein n=1 Tax=Blepharisma stoltei TaxID=1481888 RepID=A0AAU9K6K6_9CILI|nr:unnamed protein product [Blepharisma stoltei]
MKSEGSSDESKLTCNICQQTIKHSYSLERHIKVVHYGFRPFKCDCGKSFATREQLTRHHNSKHSEEKPFVCEKGCNKAFASYSARSYHHNIVHEKQKFKCPMLGCSKEYSSMHHLRNHQAKPHDPLIQILNSIKWLP